MRNALQLICSKMKTSSNLWMLKGDTALVLQGVAVNSNNLQFLTDRLGAFELGNHLSAYGGGIHTYREGSMTFYRGTYKMFNIQIDIYGDWVLTYNNYKIQVPVEELFMEDVFVEVGEYQLRVVPLEWQLFFDIIDRREKKHLQRILIEEPDHNKVFFLFERFGLLSEFKSVMNELFK